MVAIMVQISEQTCRRKLVDVQQAVESQQSAVCRRTGRQAISQEETQEPSEGCALSQPRLTSN